MSTKECRTVSRRLSARLDGRLVPSEEVQVRKHLAGCGRCRGEWEELQELRRVLAALPTPALRGDALQRLHAALPARRPRAAWVPAVCGVALAMIAAALVQHQFASRDDGASRAGDYQTALADPLAGATAEAQVHPAEAPQTMASLPGEAEVKIPETPTGGARHTDRATRPHGKRYPAAAPRAEPESYIVIAVSPGPATSESARTEPPRSPGSEIVMTRLAGQDGQPEAELILGRTIGEDLNVERIVIAYHPVRKEELGTTTPQPSQPSEKHDDEPNGDVPRTGDEDRDARSHPRVGLPSACLRASEA